MTIYTTLHSTGTLDWQRATPLSCMYRACTTDSCILSMHHFMHVSTYDCIIIALSYQILVSHSQPLSTVSGYCATAKMKESGLSWAWAIRD